ncbi:uncharacterized protein MELLADRAFT_105684 [Melampsora larici-populina 98AG31]|uniref:Secreted protein n=1 Tax=Melampsora larici-populina (strain 98AG31 / pathotype 3-4-7) TaxID=747676 RepID=F4RJ14_MELLP|nr:uncharacterized protein MELLADRAFT_105684 [Melampsora larici-populina 98AG31]EGG07733.1 secreted protein [Melampsora larici-populina 98AG31]
MSSSKMAKCFWFILIQPLLQPSIYTPLVHGMEIKSMEASVSGTADIPESIEWEKARDIRQQLDDGKFCNIHYLTDQQCQYVDTFWDGYFASLKEDAKDQETVLDSSTAEAREFLKKHPPKKPELGKRKGQAKSIDNDSIEIAWSGLKEKALFLQEQQTYISKHALKCPGDFVIATNELLLTGKDKWEVMIKDMIGRINSVESPLPYLQILREIASTQDITPKVRQAIEAYAIKVKGTAPFPFGIQKWFLKLGNTV